MATSNLHIQKEDTTCSTALLNN